MINSKKNMFERVQENSRRARELHEKKQNSKTDGLLTPGESKISKVFPSGKQSMENSVAVNKKVNSKEKNEASFQNFATPKTNMKFSVSRECSPEKPNNTPNKGDIIRGCNMSEPNEVIYYAVHIPAESPLPEVIVERKEGLHVYTDKEEVLNVIKLNKKARFKQFKSKKEAEDFALNGAEIQSQDGSSAIADSEKVMPFKRPKTEDMIQFRKDIERGDFESVMEKIFENPKYLVSNGDTPSILQEGSRYNALHVAAKSKNAKIARLILDTITCIDFIGYMYDDNDVNSCVSRSEILLDRYLNTPDKGSNETPLHIASKHGAVEVVRVLLSFSQCQKNNIFNRYNELPKDVICSRVNGPCEETKAVIAALLEEQYFVPVLRSEDNSLQPKVGEAFSLNNPLKLESDLLSPRLEIQAYAGPMSKEKAYLFKKRWKNPSRSVKDSLSLRLRDTEKGLEKTGRNLASELKVPWQEYWSFLDTFVDISSQEGLQLLENYLKNRFQEAFELRRDTKVISSIEDEKCFSSSNDLCETFELYGSNRKQTSSPTSRTRRYISPSSNLPQHDYVNKKASESVKTDGKNPLVYVERSCEVFGKRIGGVINSCVVFENHPESLRECLETQVKHLLTLIKSYKEDNRFQSIDFQLIHSRVATIAIQSLQEATKKERQAILAALNEIDWSDGALSDDEDLNYNYRNFNGECIGITTRQLRCLVKHLIAQLRNFQEVCNPQLSPSARRESDCQMLWSLATSCSCTWGRDMTKRIRGGLKRKQYRNDCDCECDILPRKIQFESEKAEETSEFSLFDEEDSEDNYSTPPSGNSDSEDMEDVKEIPNTFIYPGIAFNPAYDVYMMPSGHHPDENLLPVPIYVFANFILGYDAYKDMLRRMTSQPTKTDFAVLEAIENVPLSPEKYPNIYLWRHILQIQPKSIAMDQHNFSPDLLQRKILNFDSPKSSPRKFLERSFGSCESPPLQTPMVETWERVTGPYSPRRSMRSSLSMLHCENFLMSR